MKKVDYDQKELELVRQIVDHSMFNEMINTVKTDIAENMLSGTDEDAYKLRAEGRAFDRLIGRLTELANYARKI